MILGSHHDWSGSWGNNAHAVLSSYLVGVFVLAGSVLRTARVLVKAVQATHFTRPMFDITQYFSIKRVSRDSTVTVQCYTQQGVVVSFTCGQVV